MELLKIGALDHRDSLSKTVDPKYFVDFKTLITVTFAPYINWLLIDPEYGLPSIKEAKKRSLNIMMPREKSGYTDSPQGHTTVLYPEYTVKTLSSLGARAIKLLLYFNPDAKNASTQLTLLKSTYAEAKKEGLAFLLEIITYKVDDLPYHESQSILDSISILQEYADILKIQYVGAQYLTLLQSIVQKPWVLLSRGIPFEEYEKAFSLSLKHGASGFAAGRTLWQEASQYKTWNEIRAFITTEALNRIKRLSDLCDLL